MKGSKALFSMASAVAVVLILVLTTPGAALSWQGQQGVTPTPVPTNQPPDQGDAPLTVISTLELEIPAGAVGTAAVLAPNGEQFAYFTGDEVCFYRVDGTQQACYGTPEDMRLHTDSLRWSPDGTRLVFMDNDLFRRFADSDIWTLDAATGQFTNLTDDGVVGGVILRPRDANLEFSPVWSPDGAQIAFLRIAEAQGETSPVTIYTVPAGGGEAAAKQVLAEYGHLRILSIAWAPDGDTIAYFHDWREAADAMWSGIWVLKLSDPNPQRILMIDFPSLPNEMTFSPDGSHLLVTLRTGKLDSNAPEDYPAWIVPVDGSAALPFDAARIVRAAAWRGGAGLGLAYVVSHPSTPDDNGLYVAEGPGQPGVRILDGEFLGPTTYGERMAWGANGVTLLAGRGGFPLTLITTGEE